MANNPLKEVYLSKNNLDTIAAGGSITSGSDTYTADEDAIYLVPDDSEVVQTTGQSTTDVMSQKAVTDELSGKQDTLVSGTNIKTVNGQSILGSGDLSAGLVDDVREDNVSVVVNKIATIESTKIVNTLGETPAQMSIIAQASWGGITGTLSNQTDLQNALNAKQDKIQYSNIPTASSLLEGVILQYTGSDETTYKTGHFYQCRETSLDVYQWIEIELGTVTITISEGALS